MNDKLDKALEWADLLKADLPANLRWELAAAKEHAPTLAAAVRSLRETVKAREEEIERLKQSIALEHYNPGYYPSKSVSSVNPSLDAALNEGDGSYKP